MLPNVKKFHLSGWAILWICLFVAVGTFAQAPTGYYDPAIGLTGENLKISLHSIIKNHTRYPYSSSGTDVWDILMDADEDPNNSSNVILLYTNRSQDKSYNASVLPYTGDRWNREHVWAKSHGFPSESDTAYTDCHHLRAADESVNSLRNNKDFNNGGEVVPEAPGCYNDNDNWSWEPRDAVKGDIARAIFYMAVRYDPGYHSDGSTYDLELVDYTDTDPNNDGNPLFGKLSTLLVWHTNDPVDDAERARHEVVYGYQHNRNPFIDHPEYVDAIWNPGIIKDEPSNHPTNLVSSAGTPSSRSIQLDWTDANGTILPDGYLIKGSSVSYTDISDPTDGIAVADGGLNKNVALGSLSYSFTDLSPTTTYYFKMYSYTNSGTDIDYKTDPVIATTSMATTQGTSILQPGDIAFIGYGSVNPDKFAFIILVDLAGNTEITFTDNAWNGTSLATNENTTVWTAPSIGLAKGTVISIEGSTVTGGGTLSNNGLTGLAMAGDQILAYQEPLGSLSFVSGISSGDWIDSGVPTNNQSYLPTELTLLSTAVGYTYERDNGYYSGPTNLTTGTASAFINHPDNWLRDNNIQTFPAWSFLWGTQIVVDVNTSVETLIIGANETITIENNSELTLTGQ